MPARRACHWIAIGFGIVLVAAPAPPAAAENMAFITVAIDDETRAADRTLRDYLHDKTHLQFDPIEMEYAAAIQRLAGGKRGSQPYVARMTPYAYVAAEMLGASFEILGTYTPLEARKITWLNPARNAFREGDRFDVAVKSSDFFRFSLDDTRFPKASDGAGWAYDPMSNTAFRVVLVRPSVEPFIMQVLTVVFVLLLAAAAGACTVDLRRKEQPAAPSRHAQPVGLQHPELHGPGVV